MTLLYALLLLSTVAVLGVAAAAYVRVRRQLKATETALMQALEELEQERHSTKV